MHIDQAYNSTSLSFLLAYVRMLRRMRPEAQSIASWISEIPCTLGRGSAEDRAWNVHFASFHWFGLAPYVSCFNFPWLDNARLVRVATFWEPIRR